MEREGRGRAAQAWAWLCKQEPPTRNLAFFFHEDVSEAAEQHPPGSGEHLALGAKLPGKSGQPAKPALLEAEPNWLHRFYGEMLFLPKQSQQMNRSVNEADLVSGFHLTTYFLHRE